MIVIDDRELSVPEYSPVCTFCLHLRTKRLCDAFGDFGKNTIPMVIWIGEDDHTKPYPGDNGIQFERRRGKRDEAKTHESG
jgi:hypothetical protein